MHTFFFIPGVLILLFLIELVYFKIADRYNIVDRPNNRSSHQVITIRGGGIIFFLSALLFFIFHSFQYAYFILGLFLIAVISFLDDILTLNNKVRLGVQLIAVLLLICEWDFDAAPVYFIPIALIFIIGTLNAYNFMDGINGITGCYSLVAIITLFFVNRGVGYFVNPDLIIYVGLALLVFNFFNFRNKARCFAGDVGSISIAFIIIFLIGLLIIHTQNFAYILLLFVYGLDAVTTIGFRLIRKENIFEAHRSHFYQFLANEKKIPHLYISAGYGLIQLLFNIVVIKLSASSLLQNILIIILPACLFIGMRFMLEGKDYLLNRVK